MIDIKKVDSLFFDMDGTLWDGVECYAQGFNDFFKAHGIERRLTKVELHDFMGLEEDQCLEVTLPEFPYDKRKLMYKDIVDFQYSRIKIDGGILFDGVKEGLARLSQKYKLFIVSNCAEFTIQCFMDWSGINEYITDTMSYGMNSRPKHENIKYLIKKHILKNPMYVGDTDSDSKQCAMAQIPFVFVDYGFGKTQKYDFRFDSFTNLTEYFD